MSLKTKYKLIDLTIIFQLVFVTLSYQHNLTNFAVIYHITNKKINWIVGRKIHQNILKCSDSHEIFSNGHSRKINVCI